MLAIYFLCLEYSGTTCNGTLIHVQFSEKFLSLLLAHHSKVLQWPAIPKMPSAECQLAVEWVGVWLQRSSIHMCHVFRPLVCPVEVHEPERHPILSPSTRHTGELHKQCTCEWSSVTVQHPTLDTWLRIHFSFCKVRRQGRKKSFGVSLRDSVFCCVFVFDGPFTLVQCINHKVLCN